MSLYDHRPDAFLEGDHPADLRAADKPAVQYQYVIREIDSLGCGLDQFVCSTLLRGPAGTRDRIAPRRTYHRCDLDDADLFATASAAEAVINTRNLFFTSGQFIVDAVEIIPAHRELV